MTVGSVNQALIGRYYRVVGKHGKIKHHLIHLGIAVAANAQKLVFKRIKQRYNLFRGIFARQVVARSVV